MHDTEDQSFDLKGVIFQQIIIAGDYCLCRWIHLQPSYRNIIYSSKTASNPTQKGVNNMVIWTEWLYGRHFMECWTECEHD